MLDRLQQIDPGAIDDLARIKRDQDVLEDRLRLMQERREGVSEVVFERVRGDYRQRLDALEEQARPLRESARAEFAKLQELRRELQQASDEARIEREELEFRNALGEFAGDEYERRAAEAQERLDAREVDLAEVEAMAQRFLAAVRSQAELEADVAGGAPLVEPPGTPAPPMPLADEVAAPAETEAPAADAVAAVEAPTEDAPVAPALVAEPVGIVQTAPPPPPPWGAPPPPPSHTVTIGSHDDSSPTMWDEQDARPSPQAQAAAEADYFHEAPTGEFAVPPPPPAPAAVTEVTDADELELSGATRILARPRLVELDNGASGREHALALGRTSIGRASDNLVHLLDEAVSRHHAEIVPGPDGYVLRDLGSENGIFVNGDRKPEHVLHEGDVVQIGARTLVYHGA